MCAQIFWPPDLLPHFALRDNSFHSGNRKYVHLPDHFHSVQYYVFRYLYFAVKVIVKEKYYLKNLDDFHLKTNRFHLF